MGKAIKQKYSLEIERNKFTEEIYIDIISQNKAPFKKLLEDNSRYKTIAGSKDGGKSFSVALTIIYDLCRFKFSNFVVVRKYLQDHPKSTIATFEKVLYFLQNKYEINLIECPDIKISNNSSKSSTNQVKFGKQQIFFTSILDGNRISGISTNYGYFLGIWNEEPIQKEKPAKKMKDIEAEDSFVDENWDIFINTIFRDKVSSWENVSKVRYVISTWNRYRSTKMTAKLLDNYLDTVDEKSPSFPNYLENGYEYKEIKNEESNPLGISYILHTNKINPFRDENADIENKRLEINNYDLYRTISLGLPYNAKISEDDDEYVFRNTILKHKILDKPLKKLEDIKNFHVSNIICGTDWGYIDKTTFTAIAIVKNNDGSVYKIFPIIVKEIVKEINYNNFFKICFKELFSFISENIPYYFYNNRIINIYCDHNKISIAELSNFIHNSTYIFKDLIKVCSAVKYRKDLWNLEQRDRFWKVILDKFSNNEIFKLILNKLWQIKKSELDPKKREEKNKDMDFINALEYTFFPELWKPFYKSKEYKLN